MPIELKNTEHSVAPSSTTTKACGCDFHDSYFGAEYPDACCIDGYLWDLDSCYAPGGQLTSGGDEPCPQCNHALWVENAKEHFENMGYDAREAGAPRVYQHKTIRFEQPGDDACFTAWWLAGWDAAEAESKK